MLQPNVFTKPTLIKVHLISVLVMIGFTVYHLSLGNTYIGLSLLLAAGILLISLRKLIHRENIATYIYAYMAAINIALVITSYHFGVRGLIYVFPLIIGYYYCFKPRYALVLSIASSAICLIVSLNAVEIIMALRFTVSLSLLIALTDGFSSLLSSQKQDLKQIIDKDNLTGLLNRSSFQQELSYCISTLENHDELMALLFLDLDKFKQVNDTLGHSIGDKLLIEVSQRLKNAVRDSDIVARQGGDEFTILLRHLKKEADIENIITHIFQVLEQPLTLESIEWQVRASIGVCFIDSDSENPENALKKADLAMYNAKEAGRGHYKLYDYSMQQQLEERVELELQVPRALDREEFFLHYQPLYNLKTGKISAFEGLIRWQNPDMGLLMPGRFINFLEESTLIREVGYWVIEEACKALSILKSQGLTDTKLAINLAVPQLMDPMLIKQMEKLFDGYSISPSLVELEITESALMKNLNEAIKQIKKLKALGVTIAIDDFGTGYSSLSYLKELPVDTIKIDRAFIADLLTNEVDEQIVLSVLRMGHSMGKKIVAEGIETQEQLDYLVKHGVDYGQGFLLAKPGGLLEHIKMSLTIKLNQASD